MLKGTTSPLHLFKDFCYTQKYLLEETLGFTLDYFSQMQAVFPGQT